MRNQSITEIIVGIFMLLGMAALLFLALKVSGLSNFWETKGYSLEATFTNIGDLKARAPVTMAGVKIGYIKGIKLDDDNFRADVTMIINDRIRNLPKDTTASIYTQGLLGSNYISLTPGYDEQILKNGDKITTTHSAMILENLIGEFMYKVGGSK